jgi:hypothetical protein
MTTVLAALAIILILTLLVVFSQRAAAKGRSKGYRPSHSGGYDNSGWSGSGGGTDYQGGNDCGPSSSYSDSGGGYSGDSGGGGGDCGGGGD